MNANPVMQQQRVHPGPKSRQEMKNKSNIENEGGACLPERNAMLEAISNQGTAGQLTTISGYTADDSSLNYDNSSCGGTAGDSDDCYDTTHVSASIAFGTRLDDSLRHHRISLRRRQEIQPNVLGLNNTNNILTESKRRSKGTSRIFDAVSDAMTKTLFTEKSVDHATQPPPAQRTLRSAAQGKRQQCSGNANSTDDVSQSERAQIYTATTVIKIALSEIKRALIADCGHGTFDFRPNEMEPEPEVNIPSKSVSIDASDTALSSISRVNTNYIPTPAPQAQQDTITGYNENGQRFKARNRISIKLTLPRYNKVIIPREVFRALVLQIFEDFKYSGEYNIEVGALQVLQEATELYVISYFEDMNLCSLHSNRLTVMESDAILRDNLISGGKRPLLAEQNNENKESTCPEISEPNGPLSSTCKNWPLN